jgi:uncharacterized protein (DUF2062 family)
MNWRGVVEKLAGGSDSPRRTAAAFALGVFLSFSPFIFFQIALGMTTAFLLRLNRPAVFIGLCVNLPWIIVPWYTMTTIAGGMILDRPVVPDFGRRFDALMELSFYSAEFRSQAFDLIAPFFWSFLIGSTAGAIVVGVAAYFVTAPLLTRWRASRDAQQRAADGHVDAP